jgi:hypothetical protein
LTVFGITFVTGFGGGDGTTPVDRGGGGAMLTIPDGLGGGAAGTGVAGGGGGKFTMADGLGAGSGEIGSSNRVPDRDFGVGVLAPKSKDDGRRGGGVE